jgi:branched-chain amino acid transport system substrate-binding protein
MVRWLIALCVALVALPAYARDKPIRIGVLNDMSGVYSDFQGIGSVIAARLAVEDFGGRAAGAPVEVLSADHQNKVDIGSLAARRWFDVDDVDLVIDVPNSAVALAVADIARERNKVLIGSGAGSATLTGARCSPNTVHWTYDTWNLASSIARAVVDQGGKTWFFITSDYAFGHDLEQQARNMVLARGGKVIGNVRHPLGTHDYSSFLLQAQSSGADVIGIATPGGDLTSLLKQAAEFGIAGKQKLAALIFAINNADGLGLQSSQGVIAANPFYWDMNDKTRAWSDRFTALHPKKNRPNDQQAGVYSAITHYLKAVSKVGDSADGAAVVAAMKAMPTDDPLYGPGTIRVDGRKTHPMYLLEAKKPSESKKPWDYFKVIGTISAEDAFRPLREGNCPLVK